LLSQADQDQHRPSGRALFPRQTGTSADQVAEPCHRMECHTPWARFGALQVGWGALGGPFSPRGRALFPRKAGRAGFLAISGHKPMGTKADQDQHRPRGRAIFPRKAGGPGRPGPAQTEGQSNHSQEGRRTRQTRTSTDRGAEPSFPGRQADQDQPDQGSPLCLFACCSQSHKPNNSSSWLCPLVCAHPCFIHLLLLFRAVSLTNPKEAPQSCCSNLGWFRSSGKEGTADCPSVCAGPLHITTAIHVVFIEAHSIDIDSVGGAIEKEQSAHDCRREGNSQDQGH